LSFSFCFKIFQDKSIFLDPFSEIFIVAGKVLSLAHSLKAQISLSIVLEIGITNLSDASTGCSIIAEILQTVLISLPTHLSMFWGRPETLKMFL